MLSDSTNRLFTLVLERFPPRHTSGLEGYRQHIHRIVALCFLMDATPDNHPKYVLAAVFHDLGIWVQNTFDYLGPSIALLRDYLAECGKPEWTDELALMIAMHHKRSPYTGVFERTVETFRRADWIDVTLGLKSYGIPRGEIRAIRHSAPNRGFHLFLAMEAIQWFLQHPTNPLPMFRK